MTKGRRARHARWRGWHGRMLWRSVAGSFVLVALASLPASGQEAETGTATAPDPAVAMWLEIRDTDDRALLTAFVDAFPDSPYAHAARARLKRLEDEKTDPGAEQAPARKRRRSR